MAERGVKQETTTSQPSHVEADAVCEQCGAVNPEDTLLCKYCGNNLREQRARRLNEANVLEKVDAGSPPTRWLAHLLTVFGLLLILWTGLNRDAIIEWLTATQTEEIGDGSSFFDGPDSSAFAPLAEQLDRDPLSQDEINRALARTDTPEAPEGRYVLMVQSASRPVQVGEAIVQQSGKELLIVALFENGVQLRGRAQLQKDGLIRAPEVGVQFTDGIIVAHGFAQRSDEPGYLCYGFTSVSEQSYEARAYPVPAEEPI